MMELSTEMHVALLSVFIAGCALFVTIWQGRQNHKHNMLSARPFLGALEHYEHDGKVGKLTFELINGGVGPAIIKNFTLLYDGKEVARNNREDYETFLKQLLKDFEILDIFCCLPGAALQVGERITLLSFVYDVEKQKTDFVNKLNLLVDYQCLYQRETFPFDSRRDRSFQGREAA
ncbi:MAG: hypothetical protein ACKVOE_08850 [Rickettsiales bacterium]